MIQIEGLVRSYQKEASEVQALRGIDLSIPRGAFVSLVGRSGSGKSTLLQLVGGLDRPTAGHIWIETDSRVDLAALSEDNLALYRRAHVGFVFQSFHLIPTLTVLENVILPLVPHNMPAVEKTQRAIEWIERVELSDRRDHLPSELSGGQQQRVAVARALVGNPSLILADEPTGELDSKTAENIIGLLIDLSREGRTLVLATHDSSLAERASLVVHIEDGLVADKEQR